MNKITRRLAALGLAATMVGHWQPVVVIHQIHRRQPVVIT